ncbi:unnamed protein product [Urochloa humidicola]
MPARIETQSSSPQVRRRCSSHTRAGVQDALPALSTPPSSTRSSRVVPNVVFLRLNAPRRQLPESSLQAALPQPRKKSSSCTRLEPSKGRCHRNYVKISSGFFVSCYASSSSPRDGKPRRGGRAGNMVFPISFMLKVAKEITILAEQAAGE